VESAPRAYRLKASNAAPAFSTSAGTAPSRCAVCQPARLRRDIKIAPWHKVTSAAPLECGHCDSTGQGLYNLALSLARAESVRTLLKQRDVDPDLLAVRSAGTLEPREQGNTEVAHSINRRVSFTVGIDE
jgi:hypothetical protein